MNHHKWILTASFAVNGCLVEPENSEHDSEKAARAAWAKMDQRRCFDAFIFPPRETGDEVIVLKQPGA